jgi:hypothetical protein
MKRIYKLTIFVILVLAAYTNSAQTKKCYAKLLTTGSFHNNEVLENADKEEWFGLFKNMSGFYLAKTKVQIERITDITIDTNENDKTGWEVQTINKDTSVILIAGLSILKAHCVKKAELAKNMVWPGDTLNFNFLGKDYKLFAAGSKMNVTNNPEWYDVTDYELYIAAYKNGQYITDTLIKTKNFSNAMINIIFAGDIDGDGFPDLVIDTSGEYDATCPTLYLSKPAYNEHLLIVVGKHTRYYW